MSVLPERGTTIVRLRLRGGGEDPLAAQLRAAQVFAAAGDLSDAVPPAAILCVRRLADPSPGQVVLARRTAPVAWTRAVRDRLQDLARRAARPARDAATDGHEAVFFADRAELLACLARDLCAGAFGRWWWRSLVGDGAGLDVVLRAWFETPTYVAAALEQAALMHAAAGFVRRLPAAATRTLLDAVIASHALTRLRTVSDHFERPGRVGDALSLEGAQPITGDAPGARVVVSTVPWRQWVPECADPALRADQQLLLGVALTVVRAPVCARSAAFADAAVRWYIEAHAAPVRHLRTGEQNALGREPVLAPRGPSTLHFVTGPPGPVVRRALDPSTFDLSEPNTAGADAPQRATSLASPARAGHVGGDLAPDGVTVTTQYAGVFYLLNVALALELYGDFTRPATRGLDLSIWDFVALIATALLHGPITPGPDPPDDDPAWSLLAALARREAGERPGATFEPPDAWRIPIEWLHAFPERDGWRWAAAGGRLRARHPAGFLVIDVPRTNATAAMQAATELAPYGAGARRAAHPIRGIADADPLMRWLAWIATYVRARLARALNVSRRTSPGAFVCRARGRVTVTATCVDIDLPLSVQPVAIRLAGLDRDPGWIPAADKIVSFHFR